VKLHTVQKSKVVRTTIANSVQLATRVVIHVFVGLLTLVGATMTAATIEKMSIEEMAQQSTAIVRARVVAQTAERRSGIIYTRSKLAVSGRWKGEAAATVEVSVPGGKLNGIQQTFSGAPGLEQGTEYVLFLWTGRTGVTQIIGLSQGVMQVAAALGAQKATVSRAASEATVLNAAGQPVADEAVSMSLSSLDRRIRAALGGAKP
jgi:hypothetical protein